MKKSVIFTGMALASCLFALTGCGAAIRDGNTAEAPVGSSSPSDVGTREPQGGYADPLALLDTIEVADAFGDSAAEGWSLALEAVGDLTASYGFSLYSEVSGEEKVNVACSASLGLEDLFGVRSDAENASGFGLFGGGKVSLSLLYRGPDAGSEPVSKEYDVNFHHDGDLILYAEAGEGEVQTSLSALRQRIEGAAMAETFGWMENAFSVIPEELGKGVSLRLAVEKLIDLGFAVEVDDTNGLAVSIRAEEGFYTDLLNDMLEAFLPAEWLTYLPRVDFRFEKTVFDLQLCFDESGMFREYSMTSDLALVSSLEVRNLFSAESRIQLGGGISFTAGGELPEEQPEE